MSEDNTVYIGKKEISVYLFAVQTQVNKGYDHIILKARGGTINKAVDVSQITIHRSLQGWGITEVKIGTEDMPAFPREGQDYKEGDTQRVSWIEIHLNKE